MTKKTTPFYDPPSRPELPKLLILTTLLYICTSWILKPLMEKIPKWEEAEAVVLYSEFEETPAHFHLGYLFMTKTQRITGNRYTNLQYTLQLQLNPSASAPPVQQTLQGKLTSTHPEKYKRLLKKNSRVWIRYNPKNPKQSLEVDWKKTKSLTPLNTLSKSTVL